MPDPHSLDFLKQGLDLPFGVLDLRYLILKFLLDILILFIKVTSLFPMFFTYFLNFGFEVRFVSLGQILGIFQLLL